MAGETEAQKLEKKKTLAREATARWRLRNLDKIRKYYQNNKDDFKQNNLRRNSNPLSKEKRETTRKILAEKKKNARRAERKVALESKSGRKILDRVEAKQVGLKRFFSGILCPYGHNEDRFTSTGGCVVCQREASARWRKKYPEKLANILLAWAETPSGVKDKKRRSAYNCSPQGREKSRDRYEGNKAARSVSIAAWQKANPLSLRANKNRYRAKKKAGGSHTADDIKALFKLQAGKCAHSWCRVSLKVIFHVDHIVPISRGGLNEKTNLQLLCPSCNHKKSASDPIDFARRHGLLL